MLDINTIKQNLEPDYLFLIWNCFCCLLLIGLIILVRFIRKYLKTRKPKTDQSNVFDRALVQKSLGILNKLKAQVSSANSEQFSLNLREYFHKTSEAIRMTGSFKIQRDALNLTRSELLQYKISSLDDLLLVSNQVQFSTYLVDKEFTLKIINLAIDFVNQCL